MSLSSAPPPTQVRRYAANPRGRDLVVGDVHGHFSKLRAALEAVGFDPGAGDRLFALGDLVDRGPESDQVLWWLDQPWFVSVQGNHETMALEFAAGAVDAPWYAANGGAWFIGKTRPEKLPFIDAFAALPVAVELETAAGLLGLVHADCPATQWLVFVDALQGAYGPNEVEHAVVMAQWSRDRADRILSDGVGGVRAVLVGHTPVDHPMALGNVIFLDCGAWLEADRPFCILDAATLAPAFGQTLSPPPRF